MLFYCCVCISVTLHAHVGEEGCPLVHCACPLLATCSAEMDWHPDLQTSADVAVMCCVLLLCREGEDR
jgi:hypothetical protein